MGRYPDFFGLCEDIEKTAIFLQIMCIVFHRFIQNAGSCTLRLSINVSIKKNLMGSIENFKDYLKYDKTLAHFLIFIHVCTFMYVK